MRRFSPFLTQIVSRIHFVIFHDHLKSTIFVVFVPFPFSVSLAAAKKTKTKNAIVFSKTSFLTSRQFCENTILAQIATICVINIAQNTIKMGGGRR